MLRPIAPHAATDAALARMAVARSADRGAATANTAVAGAVTDALVEALLMETDAKVATVAMLREATEVTTAAVAEAAGAPAAAAATLRRTD